MKPIWIATLLCLSAALWCPSSASAGTKRFPGGVTANLPPGYKKKDASSYIKKGDEAEAFVLIYNGLRDGPKRKGVYPYPKANQLQKVFGPLFKSIGIGPLGEMYTSFLKIDGLKFRYYETETENVRKGERYFQMKVIAGPSNHGYLTMAIASTAQAPTNSAIMEAQKLMNELVIKTIPSVKLHGN